MKKLIALLLVLLFGISIYFTFFHQDKSLKYIPKEADMVILIDVKKMKRESVFSLLTHPSEWFRNSDMKSLFSSLNNSGLKMPDFLQIAHLKNQRLTDWTIVLEISDKEKLVEFLKTKNFKSEGIQIYEKEDFCVVIDGDYCVAGTSLSAAIEHRRILSDKNSQKIFEADSFINETSASISFMSEGNQSYAIELLEDEIEITNAKDTNLFKPLITQLNKKNFLLNLDLDGKNTRNIAELLMFKDFSSTQIADIKMIADLESVNDTIVTYEYDDNFNEVEKKSFQKLTQPNYFISAKSLNPAKTLEFFNKEKWINSENQMIVIPYQPKLIRENENIFTVKSLRKPMVIDVNQKGNFIFFKNDDLLTNLINNLSASEKEMLSKIESVFYGNEGADYLVKIKFKKGKMPLILK